MPVLIILAIMAAHEGASAFLNRRVIAAAVLISISAALSGYTIVEGMGRRAETLDSKTAKASKAVASHADVAADYAKAKTLVEQARGWRDTECASGIGPLCRAQTFTHNQRLAHANALKAQLDQMQAPPPVDPTGVRVSWVAGKLGYDGASVREGMTMLWPVLLQLLLEVSSAAMFIVGIGHKKTEAPKIEAPTATTFERPLSDAEIEELRRVLHGMRRPATNDELAEAMQCSKGEASKRVQKAVDAGVVTKFRSGRFNQIAMVA